MKVTVFGASGKVGQILVATLLANGYSVNAFIHHNSPFEETAGLNIFQGDIYDLNQVREAIKGSQAILSTLGSWGTPQKDIVASGTKNIITAMSDNPRRRIITLTGSDAVLEGEKRSFISRLTHLLISISPARKILQDGERHMKLLHDSNLDWSVIRSPAMTGLGKADRYKLSNSRSLPWQTVNRLCVALAMVKVLESEEFIKQAPFISRS